MWTRHGSTKSSLQSGNSKESSSQSLSSKPWTIPFTSPRLLNIVYLVPYFSAGPIGLWSKVVHYIGNRVWIMSFPPEERTSGLMGEWGLQPIQEQPKTTESWITLVYCGTEEQFTFFLRFRFYGGSTTVENIIQHCDTTYLIDLNGCPMTVGNKIGERKCYVEICVYLMCVSGCTVG
jgi:hypothetical protein